MKSLWFIMFSSYLFLVLSQPCFRSPIDLNQDIEIRIWYICDTFQGISDITNRGINVFESTKVYIVLQKNSETEYTIYYLSMKESKMVTKEKMVNCVIELWHSVKSHNASATVYIMKEKHHSPTKEFINIFGTHKFEKILPWLRMYRVTNCGRGPIYQVSPKFQELDRSDIFVLDKYPNVYLFNVKPYNKNWNNHQIEFSVAIHFAMEISENIHNVYSTIDDKEGLNRFTEQLTENEDLTNIPTQRLLNINELIEKTTLNKYQFITRTNEFKITKIDNSEFFYSKTLNSENCYVLTKENLKERFIYIGNRAQPELIKEVLLIGERHPEYEVSIVNEDRMHPAFKIMFRHS